MKRLISWPLLCLVSFTVLFTYLSYYHLGDKLIWYDESGQFFIAKGLNHYSDPYSEPSGLGEVIQNNRDYNKDPGGFGVLLHFWTMISDSVWFLRLLPYLFFVGFLYFSYRIAKLVTGDRSVAIATAGVVLLVFSTRLTEIRPYSMELFGLSIATYALLSMDFKCPIRKLALFSLLLCFFCTSRYSFILDSFAIVLFLAGNWWLNKDGKFILRSVSFGLPLLLTVIAIYAVTTFYQNKDLQQLHYLTYLSDKPIAFLYPLSILYYGVVGLLFYTYRRGGRLFLLNVFTAVLATVHFGASVMGVHPWGLDPRSCSVIYVCMITYVFVLYDRLRSSARLVNVCLIAFCVLPVIVLSKGEFFKRDCRKYKTEKEAIRVIRENVNQTVYVSGNLNPSLRYLFEYGILKDEAKSLRYPDRFVFGKGIKHSDPSFGVAKSSGLSDYNCDIYIIAPVLDSTLYERVEGYNSVFRRRPQSATPQE